VSRVCAGAAVCLLSVALSVSARIGETPAECQKRYGYRFIGEDRYDSPLTGAVIEKAVYVRSGFFIIVHFLDGRADCIKLRKIDQNVSGIPGEISQMEIVGLLKANAPEREWKRSGQTPNGTTWTTDDGTVIASYTRTDNSLLICTKEYAARANAEGKAAPADGEEMGQEPAAPLAPPGAGIAPGWPAAHHAPELPTTVVYAPDQVRRDPSCWGKSIIVRGKATQAGRELDGTWLVILEGILRCRLSGGLATSSGIVRHVISVQGTVVPRPDKVITSGPHMVDCIILGF